jgi:hypothetical protein
MTIDKDGNVIAFDNYAEQQAWERDNPRPLAHLRDLKRFELNTKQRSEYIRLYGYRERKNPHIPCLVELPTK